ncbi:MULTISPECIES: 2-C-methyl-D-erythritol 4-phosphate cytidylyltransferase [Ramlibacter]|uniref:2-C-methyl-D-erythritol 4-phosphate cytidylyltransferase n=1 Tax=Ramlibacter pinisoli TaxID=2682844 RepID=A0A6N8IWD0_9BURK|nr:MULTISPECIES: 2-C-methyl-D-erythritol 4-phosphate cytidylyltransferase [Ramlibacter]MBA2961335.1 2-C-methyl-D-erythritol 4-phosphate cytidylyltransferase [Ramlibacter sp. CGMCC 1.13660]MVQ31279.1 2-C-methyl-D-erythritol 4-phosphate cytidylyltransferase [Ramlibacter pinisoli]
MAPISMPAHPSDSPVRFHAVLPCAGTGSRAGTEGPKQYEPLAGRMLVLHTLAALAQVRRLASLLVMVAPDDRRMPAGSGYTVVACGGATRAQTVANGLDELHRRGASENDWVLVHDAARCLVTPALVDRLIDACADDTVGGLLAQPLADTLKEEAGGRVAATLPRQGKWLAQTPQMFRLGLLRRALAEAGPGVTDEASAIEALGLQARLVQGSAQNFKVTWPEDFALARAVLESRTT